MLRYANLQLLWAWLPFCFDLLVPVTDQLGLVQSVYYPPGFGVLLVKNRIRNKCIKQLAKLSHVPAVRSCG